MPGVCRANVDSHIGHASPTPNPFHQAPYIGGSSNVVANGNNVIRVGDKAGCGDPAGNQCCAPLSAAADTAPPCCA